MFVRDAGGWTPADLEEYVDYGAASGQRPGDRIHVGGVGGPDPLDPPYGLDLIVEAVRGGQVLLNGMAYETGDFVWTDLREDPHRVVVAKVVWVGKDACVVAPMKRLLWERASRAPF